MEQQVNDVLENIDINKEDDNVNIDKDSSINDDSILMIPEIDDIDDKEFEKEFQNSTVITDDSTNNIDINNNIPILPIEEEKQQQPQQPSQQEDDEEIQKNNIVQMNIETENDKKLEQSNQQEQQNKEGYGNDDVTEMVLTSVLYVSKKALSGAQFLGNVFADIFGFGEGKYQYHIDEYNMIQEEKKRKLAEKALKESNMESQPHEEINNNNTTTNSVSISSISPSQQLSSPNVESV